MYLQLDLLITDLPSPSYPYPKKLPEELPVSGKVANAALLFCTLGSGPKPRITDLHVQGLEFTHRPLSSSVWGLPYRILNINHKRNYLGAYG